MATTSPDNIRTPDAGDQYALVQDLGALADSTQNALVRRANFYIGTSTQRLAFTTAREGTRWQDSNGSKSLYIFDGGIWKTQDTGWVSVRLASGWSGSIQVRFKAGVVYFTGSISRNNFSGAYEQIATMPSSFPKPSQATTSTYVSASGSNPASSNLRVSTSGSIFVRRNATATTAIEVDSLFYVP